MLCPYLGKKVSVFREACLYLGNGHYELKPMITNNFFCDVLFLYITTLCSMKFVQDLTDLSVIYKIVTCIW